MNFRNSIVFVHRWLALVAGVFWGIAAFTGGILVFEGPIDRALNGGRFEVSGGQLPPGGLDRALAERFPDETVRSMAWLREDGAIRLTMQGAAGRRQAFLDAGNGRIVTNMRPRIELIAPIRRLHTSLFARRPGAWLVTAASFAALLSMITGLYLWWPGIRAFFRGFSIRLRRGAYIFNFDLHQVLGILTFVLLFVMTGTGVIMGIPGASPRIARIVMPPDDAHPATDAPVAVSPAAATAISGAAVPGPEQSATPGIEEMAATAERAADGRAMSLAFLSGEPARVEIRVRPSRPGSELTRVLLDPVDGRVVEVADFGSWNREARFGTYVSRWHTANFPSLLVRILFSAACILGFVIVATGFVVWWLKRTRKLASAKRRQGAPATT
ncbi:MAG: PepSY-associated TM helix domain-containing protein [Gemmatimonadota bacterium]|jgi:uncharacterized iron-regulated membrane protein